MGGDNKLFDKQGEIPDQNLKAPEKYYVPTR